jgi:O-glycosyl hydrolase
MLVLAVGAVALFTSDPTPRGAETALSQVAPSACILVQTARGTTDRLHERPCGAWVHAADHFAAHAKPRATARAEAIVELTGAEPVAHEILGFGGAFTESAALVFEALPLASKQNFLAAYFGGPPAAGAADGAAGAAGGIGYSLGRVHINSCDFSIASYSFADVPEDFSLAHFDDSLAHDARTMLPLIKAAQGAIGAAGGAPLRLLASPWSPPGWMKASGRMDGSSAPLGLRAECRAVWAAYVSRWLAGYAAHGVPIWAVTMQNEPENSAPWEACMFTAEAAAAWVREHLGPTIRREHGDAVKIFAYDHNKVCERRRAGERRGRGWRPPTSSRPTSPAWPHMTDLTCLASYDRPHLPGLI